MMIPGANILNTVLRVIARQTFVYNAYLSRTANAMGDYVANYYPSAQCSGNAQPVPREKFEDYGLDFNKRYFNFFVSRGVIDVGRDVSGDQIVFECRYYQVISITPWIGIDGWNQILAVEVPNPNA